MTELEALVNQKSVDLENISDINKNLQDNIQAITNAKSMDEEANIARYKNELKTQVTQHDEEIESLKKEHAKSMESLMTNHAWEMSKIETIRMNQDKDVEELKVAHAAEIVMYEKDKKEQRVCFNLIIIVK